MRTTVTCHISKYRVHVIPYKIIIVTMHKSGTYSTVTIAVAVGKSLLASGTCDVSNESALCDSESVGPLSSLAMCDATGWKSRCAAINRPLSSCATNGSLLEQARMQWTMA